MLFSVIKTIIMNFFEVFPWCIREIFQEESATFLYSLNRGTHFSPNVDGGKELLNHKPSPSWQKNAEQPPFLIPVELRCYF